MPRNLLRFSEKELRQKPPTGKWSKIEILGHLIDSARYNLLRFTEISIEAQPYTIRTYSQAELVKVQNYQNASLDNLTLHWQMLNQQIFNLIESYDPSAAQWEIILPDGRINNLFFLADDYVEHMEHHLRQILEESHEQAFKRSFSVAEGIALLEKVETPFVELSRDGNWVFEYYAPQEVDLQQPHSRDEVYFIISGSGMFVNGNERHAFAKGDLLFVPAGVVHRFEEFSDDFACWVVFGGGELN